jgi:hypothetical protein
VSLATTLARAAAQQAGEVRKAHRGLCAKCDMAMYRHRYSELCPQGRAAPEIRRDLDAQADREAAADKAPNPNQKPLF